MAVPALAAGPSLVDGVSGVPIDWADWVGKRGPAAVLMWASWAPRAESVIDSHDEIADACREAGLELIVLDVQESIEDGKAALGPKGVPWFHDRHGALLKQYRVIRVPSLVIVSAEGEPLVRMDPTAAAVRSWSSR